MKAIIKTQFNISADDAWKLLQQRDTFLYITRGFLGFSGSKNWPEKFYKDLLLHTRLIFYHIIPGWKHRLKIIQLDHLKYELFSNESGGPVRAWNHLIKIEPEAEHTCRYMDQIDIKAGILTPFIWGYAHLFYRYRQRRWKKLIQLNHGIQQTVSRVASRYSSNKQHIP